MSYRIQYSPDAVHKYPQKRQMRQIKWGNVLLILLVVLSAIWMRMKGVPDFLIPGDPEVTKSAAAALVDRIQSGDPVNNAVTVFCKQILDGAQ